MRQISLGIAVILIGVAVFLWRNDPPELIALNPSGFRAVYLIPTKSDRVQILLTVQSGEIDNQGTPGLPHFVEHLAWYNSVGADRALIDRHSNAFTSAQATQYFLSVDIDQAAGAISTLSKVFAPLGPDTDFMRSERDIVMREYDLWMMENPLLDRLRVLDEASYGDDPRARSLIGARIDIATFSLDEARLWHSTTHRRDNAVLVIYGNVDARRAQTWVLQALPDQAPMASAALDFAPLPAQTLNRKVTVPNITQPFLLFQKNIRVDLDWDYAMQTAQLNLLYDILDSTLAGSYAKPLRFDGTWAQSYDPHISAHSLQDLVFGFYPARPDAGVTLDQLQDAILRAVQDVASMGIPQDSFDRVKSRWLARIQTAEPDFETFQLTMAAIAARQPPVTFSQYRAAASAITLDDMNHLARAMAGSGRLVIDQIFPQ